MQLYIILSVMLIPVLYEFHVLRENKPSVFFSYYEHISPFGQIT